MSPAGDEPMHSSLRTLDETMRAGVAGMVGALRHYQAMDELRSGGHSWDDVLDAVGDPADVPNFNRLVGDIVDAAARTTRATVAVMLANGVPQRRIATLLGVTHQRTSQIVKNLQHGRGGAR